MSDFIYWEDQFKNRFKAHSDQNFDISNDFLKNLNINFKNIIDESSKIIEVGCGTGELSYLINKKYNKKILGIDVSNEAIKYAQQNYLNSNLEFKCLNLLTEQVYDFYDLAICSNVLEHFKNPFVLIDKILSISKFLIALVPYEQPCTDSYEYEGGAGHVFTFNEYSFNNYNLNSYFIFTTPGWQHSALDEVPKQLAVLLTKK